MPKPDNLYEQRPNLTPVDMFERLEAQAIEKCRASLSNYPAKPAIAISLTGTTTFPPPFPDLQSTRGLLQESLRKAGFRVLAAPKDADYLVSLSCGSIPVQIMEISGNVTRALPDLRLEVTRFRDGEILANAATTTIIEPNSLGWRSYRRNGYPGLLRTIFAALIDSLSEALVPSAPPSPFNRPRSSPAVIEALDFGKAAGAQSFVIHRDSRPITITNLLRSGTGFFVGNRGHLVTCFHVIKNSSNIFVMPFGSKPPLAKAELVAFSETDDIALLRLEGEYLSLPIQADEAAMHEGLSVFTWGYPSGGYSSGALLYVEGKVAATSVPLRPNSWILNLPVDHGNSGGAVCSSNGEVVGLITHFDWNFAARGSFLFNYNGHADGKDNQLLEFNKGSLSVALKSSRLWAFIRESAPSLSVQTAWAPAISPIESVKRATCLIICLQ